MYGIWVDKSSGNIIYKNKFIKNNYQTYIDLSNNTWNDGYPSGGNYWSDYIGTDAYSGPYQNETGPDGISDKPYAIDKNNQDNYPVISLWRWEDTTPPSGSISISNGDVYANSTSVILSLSASDATSGVSQMRFSNDNITWTSWESYSTSKTWVLTTGDGTKPIYAQYKDNAGLTSSSYSDTIILDTTPPIISVISPSDGTETRSSDLIIQWYGTDATSGIDHYEIRLDSGSWINLGTNTTHTFTRLGDGTYTVEVKAFDKAGNSQAAPVNFIVNTSPIGGPGYTEEVALTVLIILIVLAIVVYASKLKRKPKS